MNEWVDVSKQQISGNFCWVTDGKTIEFAHLRPLPYGDFYFLLWSNNRLVQNWVTHWMLIEEPELPKPKLHYCMNESTGRDLVCEETVAAAGNINLWLRGPGEFCIKAKACPFCGYSSKGDS